MTLKGRSLSLRLAPIIFVALFRRHYEESDLARFFTAPMACERIGNLLLVEYDLPFLVLHRRLKSEIHAKKELRIILKNYPQLLLCFIYGPAFDEGLADIAVFVEDGDVGQFVSLQGADLVI